MTSISPANGNTVGIHGTMEPVGEVSIGGKGLKDFEAKGDIFWSSKESLGFPFFESDMQYLCFLATASPIRDCMCNLEISLI